MKRRLEAWTPLFEEGVLEKFTPPPFIKPGATEEEKAAGQAKKKIYMENIKQGFRDLAAGKPSGVYLALQPIFQISRGDSQLVILEVLARVKNGTDAAPMPGMAEWQVQDREGALMFLGCQLDFAVESAAKYPGTDISVNVRPDELLGIRDKILEVSKKSKSILIEITEYAPITDEIIAIITDMKAQGVRFALDDVTKVVESPANGYAKQGAHACSFELGKTFAHLFEVQKLTLALSCVAYRVNVYPTPCYAGGQPSPFFERQILPHSTGTAPSLEILERKKEIEDWVAEVISKAPATRFVIEASIHEADLDGKEGLIPEIPNFFDGAFCMQGGIFGGRAFTPEALLDQDRNPVHSVNLGGG